MLERMAAEAWSTCSWSDGLAPPLGGEGQRHAGQLLDDAVVEIAGDPSPLGVGCVESCSEQTFLVLLAGLQPARHRPRERDLDEFEHDQRAERDRGEL